MFGPMAPNTNIGLKSDTKSITNGAVGRGVITALPPLVIKLLVFPVGDVFRYDVLALGFSELQVFADLMDDDPTFLAF
jgi:hypothetical protein